MSDVWDLPEFRELRRQDEAARRELDDLEELLWAQEDAEENQLLAGWVDSRGRPLPGFEPHDIPGRPENADGAHRRMMIERFAIERAADRRKRALQR
jgi:hypothetical protein